MKAKMTGAGSLTERLTFLTNAPVLHQVASITRVGSLATATTQTDHGFTTGDYAAHEGAGQAAYNVEAQVTVTGPRAYTFAVAGTPATPATGASMTAVFARDASGGHETAFRVVATVWGSMLTLSSQRTRERLEVQAIGSIQTYRGRIYYRSDITPQMRVSWTPFGFAAPKTLEIHGVMPDPEEPRRFLLIDAGEVA